MKNGTEKTKRFVKGPRQEIRSKLVPLQLRIYLHAVEKSLEVEMDIQESQEDWARDLSVSKHPRYQNPSSQVSSGSSMSKGVGSYVTPTSEGISRGREA